VIAVDTESDFPQETESKTKFDAMSPDEEALEELRPDVVVVMGGPEEVVQSLDQRGLPVLWLELTDSFITLFDQIDVLGEMTGNIERSDALVDMMDGRVIEFLDLVGAIQGPRIYHELDDDLTTASFETLIGELYLILNAISIADDPEQPFPQLTLDAIIEADPEVIIVAHSDASPESVEARPGWQDISAVKNDRVYAVDPDIVDRPGPRLVDGLETLARLLHPDLFPQP
jgi:iron complex transport system substrate-binding protein